MPDAELLAALFKGTFKLTLTDNRGNVIGETGFPTLGKAVFCETKEAATTAAVELCRGLTPAKHWFPADPEDPEDGSEAEIRAELAENGHYADETYAFTVAVGECAVK